MDLADLVTRDAARFWVFCLIKYKHSCTTFFKYCKNFALQVPIEEKKMDKGHVTE